MQQRGNTMSKEADDQLEFELNERHAALANAVGAIHARAAAARDRLPELRKQLGETILAAELGDVPSEEVAKVRMAIFRAEKNIEASELIIQPEHRMRTRIEGEMTKVGRRQRYRREFEALRDKLAEAGAANEFEQRDLRALAASAGDPEAADVFLSMLASKGQEAA
jgi:fructose/tagatose bisphosphate aldolase